VQPPLQNLIFEGEEEVEGLERGADINCLRDKEGMIHLTEAEYEDFMSYTQNNEVSPNHSMIAVDHQSRYNIISKKIDETYKLVAQPKKNNDAVKISVEKYGRPKILVASDILAEKQVTEHDKLEIPVAFDFPSLEVRIAHKPHSTLNFENEIKKIKILVPLAELMKNQDFKNTFMKSL